MMSREKAGADIAVYGKNATPFSASDLDLGNMDRAQFVVVFIKDLQPNKKETSFLHAEVVDTINKIPNLFYKGMKIWADESTKLYPYGYPFSFVANQIHQYILVFRKEK